MPITITIEELKSAYAASPTSSSPLILDPREVPLEWTMASSCNCHTRHGGSHPVAWASPDICLCPVVVVPDRRDP